MENKAKMSFKNSTSTAQHNTFQNMSKACQAYIKTLNEQKQHICFNWYKYSPVMEHPGYRTSILF